MQNSESNVSVYQEANGYKRATLTPLVGIQTFVLGPHADPQADGDGLHDTGIPS